MGILSDLLQGIPLNNVLREKIIALEAKYGSVETENAILKDDLREAKAEIVKLKDEIKRLTHISDLNETDIKILTSIVKAGGSAPTSSIAQAVDLHPVTFKNSITGLLSRKYIAETYHRRFVTGYKLAPRGLKYADENNLMADT